MKFLPRAEYLILGLGLCLAIFLIGATTTYYKIFPYSVIAPAFYAISSVRSNIIRPYFQEIQDNEHYYSESRYSSRGLRHYDPDKAYPGLTLFSSTHEPAAYLISMDGKEVHRWSLPFSEVWEDPPHVEVPVPDRFIFFRKTYLYPNGDLLAIYETPSHWPYGYGLIKIDKDSKLIWRFADMANHDLDIGPDGNIYVLVHHVRSNVVGRDGTLLRKGFTIDDELVVLTPDGQEVNRVSILDALMRSDYSGALAEIQKDAMHANSVEVATREEAEHFDFVQEGQVLLSLRDLSMVAILDIPSQTVTWAMQGAWRAQHTARFLDNGVIGVFDNKGRIREGGRSRFIEFDPRDGGITWEYGGSQDNRFESLTRGELQRLPNGNTLITESNAGRILEINRDKEVVWEYVINHEVDGKVPAIFWAQRIDTKSLTFLSDGNLASLTTAAADKSAR